MVIGQRLSSWFRSSLPSFIEAFGLSQEPTAAQRSARCLQVLRYAASRVVGAPSDAHSFARTCMVLAAASQYLGVEPDIGNWEAAYANVTSLQASSSVYTSVGAHYFGAVATFKDQFDQALMNAGVAGVPTTLDEQNRRTALLLAMNWGMRFLIALALEMPPPRGAAIEHFRVLLLTPW